MKVSLNFILTNLMFFDRLTDGNIKTLRVDLYNCYLQVRKGNKFMENFKIDIEWTETTNEYEEEDWLYNR